MGRTANSDGYVTLAVLLVVGLLAAIASSLLAVARPALGLARLGGDQVAASALLEGGVEAAAFLLFGVQQDSQRVDGYVLRLNTGDAHLAITDEAARVDLNTADPDLLAGLFTAVGAKSISAEAFASRVADWRDEDSDLNQDGAESSNYSDAGLDYGPSNLPFHSVEEARQILGLAPSDFELLRPYLTVYSGTTRIDPVSASATVLRAIPGASDGDVQKLLKARAAGESRSEMVEALADMSQYLLDQGSGVYRVRVDAQLKDGYTDTAEAVIIAPQADGSGRYRTVAWSRPTTAPPSQ